MALLWPLVAVTHVYYVHHMLDEGGLLLISNSTSQTMAGMIIILQTVQTHPDPHWQMGIIDAHGVEEFPEVMQELPFKAQTQTNQILLRPYRPRCWLEGGKMMTSNTSEGRILVSELELTLPGKE